MSRGEGKTRELLEGIAATAASMGIVAFKAMYDVQTEPLEAIEQLAVIHESLGWIQNEIKTVSDIWQEQGQPDIYTTAGGWQQGTLIE